MSKQPSGVIVGQKGVQYGLQKVAPKKPGAHPVSAAHRKAAPANVFGDDSEEEDVERQIARQADKKRAAAKVQQMYEEALAADPSVFDYDGVYDSIQEARLAPKQQDKVQRQSKYISSLLEQAQQRKREQDVLYERRMVKERQQEDHLYEDKERFVTSAYRKKLEEDKKLLEAEKQKELDEQRNDVRKIGHMGNFYANLLTKNVAYGTAKPTTEGAGDLGPKDADAAAAQAASGGGGDRAASTSPGRSGGSGGGGDGAGSSALAAAGPSAKALAQLDRYDMLRLEAERALRERRRAAEEQQRQPKEQKDVEEQGRDRERADASAVEGRPSELPGSEPRRRRQRQDAAEADEEVGAGATASGDGERDGGGGGGGRTAGAEPMDAAGRKPAAAPVAPGAGSKEGQSGLSAEGPEAAATAGKRRNDETAVLSARERYLARKQQRTS